MKKVNLNSAVLTCFLAAILFGISTPFSKFLLDSTHPIILAGFLYFGAVFHGYRSWGSA